LIIKKEEQQQQGLLTRNNPDNNNNNNNNNLAYRNFVHSIKSPRTRQEYIKSLRAYMNWLSLYEYDTILQKDPRFIASDIIETI
jgi:hypothetical protein